MISEVKGCEYTGGYEESFERPSVDVVIAGAQKSGTTSLKEYLSSHSEILSHNQKEFGYLVRNKEYSKGYDNVFNEYFRSNVGDDVILLAKSVGVMYIEEAMKRTYNHNKNMKVIVVIRNPVDRAYSAYWYMRQKGWESEKNFMDAIRLEDKRIKEGGELARHCGYIDRGMYSEQIELLYKTFDRDRVLVTKFENVKANTQKGYKKILDFLGLHNEKVKNKVRHNRTKKARMEDVQRAIRKLERSKFAKKVKSFVYNLYGNFEIGKPLRWIEKINEVDFETPEMENEVRCKLKEVFRDDIVKTQNITGIDLSDWIEE